MDEKEFREELKQVKEAEKERERTLSEARKEAEKIFSDAQSKAKKIVFRAGEETKEAEEKMIAEGRKKTGQEERIIVEEAEAEAKRISTKKLSPQGLKKISEKIME